jgi:hypothetical protein
MKITGCESAANAHSQPMWERFYVTLDTLREKGDSVNTRASYVEKFMFMGVDVMRF